MPMRPVILYSLVVVLPAIVLPAVVIPGVYAYVASAVEGEPLLVATLAGIVVAGVSSVFIARMVVSPIYSSTVESGLPHTGKKRVNLLVEPRERLRMLRELVDELVNSVDVVIVAEKSGRIIYGNRGTRRLLGYRALLGTPLEHIFLHKRECEGLLKRTERDGRVEGVQMEMISKDGSAVFVATTTSFIRDCGLFILVAQDTTQSVEIARRLSSLEKELTDRIQHLEDFRAGVLSMVKDLEESENRLHNAYMELKNTQAQLVHSSKLKALGELTAGLAHELAQPLTAIRGLVLHMLRYKELRREDVAKLELINRATEKMESVISHLRMFSRIDRAVFKPVDLNRIVEEAFLIAGEMLKKSRIEVERRLSPLPPIKGNRGALEQVVINLISNAKDAMPEGGRLTISTDLVERAGRSYTRLAVKDTGCGIPDDVLPRIFEPFFTTKDVDRGTGLGLSISYGIIKDHRGEILVESCEGRGTTFYVLLPVAERDEPRE